MGLSSNELANLIIEAKQIEDRLGCSTYESLDVVLKIRQLDYLKAAFKIPDTYADLAADPSALEAIAMSLGHKEKIPEYYPIDHITAALEEIVEHLKDISCKLGEH